MKFRICIGLLTIILATSFLNGCSNMKGREKVSDLQTSIRSYGQAIRWARYKNAHDFHLGKDGFKPKLVLEKYNGIKVTDYEIIEDGEVNEELSEADVVAEISFYNEEYGIVDTIKHKQHWWYDPELKKWLLDAKLPEFKK